MTLADFRSLQGRTVEEAPVEQESPLSSSTHSRRVVPFDLGLTRPVLTTARGHGRPFGATRHLDGINFALFSRHARSIQLVFYREGQDQPLAVLPLDPAINKTGDVWHIFVRGLPSDILYGYCLDGPFAPRAGHRFDPRTLLLDPYARAVSGFFSWVPAVNRTARRSATRPAWAVSSRMTSTGTEIFLPPPLCRGR